MNEVDLKSLKDIRKLLNDNFWDVCNGLPVAACIAFIDFLIAQDECVKKLRKIFKVDESEE